MSAERPRSSGSLASLVMRGLGWIALNQAATQLLAFITSITIAHFLSPREVGLATEAVVFVTLVLAIGEFGFGAVIIQRQDLTPLEITTAFWASIALGVALTLGGVALSFPVASLYGEARVQALLAVMSLTFLFTAPGLVLGGLLTRDMKFRSLELRNITASTISCATGITLAAFGFGPWAIVAQTLMISAVGTLLIWRVSPWRPSAAFSMKALRSMAGFTAHVTGAKVLNWANMNLDNLLVGRFLGAASLGAYSLAFAIGLAPVNRIAEPLVQLFFPAFSKLRDTQQIAVIWLRAVRMLAVVVAPAMLGIVVIAPDLVQVLFGAKWHAAIPALQLLAPVGLLQTLTGLNPSVLQAIDRARLLFRATAVVSVVSVAAFAAGLPWGIRGVATAYLAASLVLQAGYVWVTARSVSTSPWEWLRSLSGAAQATGLMVAAVVLAREGLVHSNVPPAGRLVALIVVGAVVYVPAVWWRMPDALQELRTIRARRGSPSPGHGVA